MNKQELKAEMARYGDRQEDLAEALGMTPATLSAKVNGAVEFKPSEIETIALRYGLYAEKIQAIFLPGLSTNRSAEGTEAIQNGTKSVQM